MDLKFKIENQKLSKNEDNFIVNKSNNYLKLFFNFTTTDWDDLSKFVILRNDKNKSYQFNYCKDGVLVPSDVLIGRQFYISVYGADETTRRITTNEIGLLLKSTGYTTDLSTVLDEEVDIFVELFMVLDTKANASDLSPVATSGDYDDLSNKPDLDMKVSNEIRYGYIQLKNQIMSKGDVIKQ